MLINMKEIPYLISIDFPEKDPLLVGYSKYENQALH